MQHVGVEPIVHRAVLGVPVVVGVCLLVACMALNAATPPAPGETGDVGFLNGQVTIGPLRPVEQVGVTPPTPPPELCTSLGLIVDRPDEVTEVMRFTLQPDCTYRVSLAPGTYVIRLVPSGLRRARNLPATVQIEGRKTTRLDLSIDTGIR